MALATVNRFEGAGLWVVWSVAALAWMGLLAALPSADAARGRTLILWAAAFHLAGIWGGPVLEDDYHRYLWDGFRFALDGTPYGTPPSDFFADRSVPNSLRVHLDQINHPDLPTIYGPLPQLMFRTVYSLAPGELWPLSLMLSAANLGVITLLARAAAPPTVLLLYAWNPLVILETSFSAHPDILAAGLALAAWLCIRGGRSATAGALLAAACASRVIFLLAVPLILARVGVRAWAAWLAVFALAYGPFLADGAAEASVLLTFGQQWQFNPGVFALAAAALGDEAARGLVLGGTLALVLALAYRLRQTASETLAPTAMASATVAVLALPLLLGPVVNAWYLIWLLPLAAVSPFRFAPWVASAALLLSYATHFNLGLTPLEDYRQPGWILALEYGLIWAAVAWEARVVILRRALRPAVQRLAGIETT
ncbi:MAG: hypothetical protein ACREVW_03740 [Burkholderiales bacterium]